MGYKELYNDWQQMSVGVSSVIETERFFYVNIFKTIFTAYKLAKLGNERKLFIVQKRNSGFKVKIFNCMT